jgi:hypothetical protein
MRTTKYILTAVLIAALLCAGMPLFSPNDANRDLNVDLKDAILRVRDFAKTAETPGPFTSEAETAISVLRHVAGLKVSIGPVKDTKSGPPSSSSNGWYLPPSQGISICFEISLLDWERIFFPESLSMKPPTPPPEMA